MPQEERKAARWEYFHTLMRDPATGTIPNNVRKRELEYARQLPRADFSISKTGAAASFTWNEAGPNDVGGRTRALGIDVDDSNVIIAGGVSGGIWKSTDGGQTWTQKTDPSGPYSITHLAQDTRSGQTDTWYAASGEYRGNSASDRGFTAHYRGSGFYKSTDNGESWQELHSAGNPTSFDTRFDYISKVVVSPTTGTVFVASNATGIYRSTDGGANFSLVLGGTNDHSWSDVAVASDGTLLATLSEGSNSGPANAPGVYTSSDDGQNWSDETPGTYPADLSRSVVAFAPSNPDIAYVFTYEGTVDDKGDQDSSNDRENVAFHRLDLGTGTSDDRTANLPDFGGKAGFVNTQGAYNMCIAVHPTDEDLVLFGTTNLWRSADGFSSAADNKADNWVGGYTNQSDSFGLYPNQHPDQHVIVFDPNDADKVWVGHDGGLSVVSDITTSTDPVPWSDMNNRYNVTQFYTVAAPGTSGDDRLMGGTQDNGTPYFRNGDATSGDVSSGDGAYAYFGSSFAYTSSQKGAVRRLGYDGSDNPDNSAWSRIYPDAIDRDNTLFIHPFAVDPSDEEVMYYPYEDHFWRNDALSSIPDGENGTSTGWTEITGISCPSGYEVTTLAVSVSNPSHRVYYGCYDSGGVPRIFRWDNANSTTSGEVSIPLSNPPSGAYPHSIAVNPQDGDEILVAFSNYNVVGLYHSDDAGQSWTSVEGNLEGTSGTPGPSLRSVTILPLGGETVYGVGTSTGIYTTTQLEAPTNKASSTTWQQQGATLMGNAVVEHLTSRQSDGQIAAGTHGRGIFTGSPGQCATYDASISSLSHRLTEVPSDPTIFANIDVEQGGSPILGLDLSDFSVDEDGTALSNCSLTAPQASGSRLADIVFIVDNSGSMGGEQADVESNIIAFVNELVANNVDFALGLTRYGQSANGGDPIIEDSGALTQNANYFKNDVLARNVTSGGHEPGYRAIVESSQQFQFRTGSQKIFILATDERLDQDQVTQNEALQALQNKSTTLYGSLETGESWVASEAQPLVDATGGQIFDIFDDFSTTIATSITTQVSSTYVLTCTSDTEFDGTNSTARTVSIDVTTQGCTFGDSGTYTPGSAPVIRPTASTEQLSDQGQQDDQPLQIEIEVATFSGPSVQNATLFYRQEGSGGSFSSTGMSPSTSKRGGVNRVSVASTTYQGEIPASAMQSPGVEYYVTVSDGQSTVSIPSTDPVTNPFQVAVLPNEPPQIAHTPPGSAPPGSDLTIDATVTDQTNQVSSVLLFYRSVGQITYQQLAMSASGGDDYAATIPGASVTNSGLEYYVKAEDDFGVVNTEGTADFPLEVGAVLYGDVSGDGQIVTNDAVQVLQHWAQLITLQGTAYTAAEVSGDAQILTNDASLVLQYWAQIITCFPVEEGCSSPKRQVPASGVLAWGTPDQRGDRLEVPIALKDVVGEVYSLQAEVALANGVQVDEINTRLPQGWQVVHNEVDGVLKIGMIGVEPLQAGTALVLSMTTNGPIPPMQATGAVASGALHTLSNEAWPEEPRRFSLAQNFPNPFNPTTQIGYELAEPSHVTVEVYNMLGQRVATLVDRQQEAGRYRVEWDINHLALSSGMYVYTLEAGSFQASKTMMLLK